MVLSEEELGEDAVAAGAVEGLVRGGGGEGLAEAGEGPGGVTGVGVGAGQFAGGREEAGLEAEGGFPVGTGVGRAPDFAVIPGSLEIEFGEVGELGDLGVEFGDGGFVAGVGGEQVGAEEEEGQGEGFSHSK